ncbi:TIGR03364 family FAD-dependent oxidoreductase [Benzoatithermus flavus]|uniref:TIGR03364 family FAD-dependent oxidoreductase n=1 Tax=Benzoatithermus flavus TaxID=3108223 RepID=A0ABU8XZF0_9PROT
MGGRTAASGSYDLAVVGAGICGLAHALAAANRGKRVVVIDRDAQANGASIRNFGFVTVTGQQRGTCWQRARRSREVWAELAPRAGIRIEQEGLVVVARRPEAQAVLEAFLATEMGEACELLGPEAARRRFPMLGDGPFAAVLHSPHELRVESRDAIPALARWLAEAKGVVFLRETFACSVEPPSIETSRGRIAAEACIVCPGDDFLSLFPERLTAYGLTRCKLHMLRVAPPAPGWRMQAPVMSDLGLVRYLGYAELPEAAALRRRLEAEQAAELANGVHLIAVQSRDGSLVVGDSHHYATTPDPFAPDAVDALILGELRAVLDVPQPRVVARWTGTYASAPDRLMLVDRPADAVRLVLITSGTGASTSFAIAEEVIRELYG